MIIEYKDTDIYQAEHLVLKKVCFQAHEGELIYIVGPVGSGKTSLLRTIYGELTPYEGRAEVMGNDMLTIRAKKLPALRKQIGIVFQDFQLLPDRTVKENLDFVLRATGWKKKDARARRIIEVLEEVGLPEKTNHRPYELSGGEQQRVCIARALLNTPTLILADEPTGNLDAVNGRNIINLLNKIREDGTTVVVTTHNMQWLQEIPGTVYRCVKGELVNEQTIVPALTKDQIAISDVIEEEEEAIPEEQTTSETQPTHETQPTPEEEVKPLDEANNQTEGLSIENN